MSGSYKSRQFHHFLALGNFPAHGNHIEGVEIPFAFTLQECSVPISHLKSCQTFKFIIFLYLEHFIHVYYEISSYTHHFPPQSFLPTTTSLNIISFLLLLFQYSLNPIRTAHMCLGMRKSTGARESSNSHNHKEEPFSFPEQASIDNSSLVRGGA